MRKPCAVLVAAAVILAACQTTPGGRTPGPADDAPAVADNQVPEADPGSFKDTMKTVGIVIIAVPLVALSIALQDPMFLRWIVDELD